MKSSPVTALAVGIVIGLLIAWILPIWLLVLIAIACMSSAVYWRTLSRRRHPA